jgi:hypothetical protein
MTYVKKIDIDCQLLADIPSFEDLQNFIDTLAQQKPPKMTSENYESVRFCLAKAADDFLINLRKDLDPNYRLPISLAKKGKYLS